MFKYTHDETDAKFYSVVYDLLVELAQAPNHPTTDEKSIFVRAFTQVEHPASEFRCCPKLGFGGKFWRNAGRVYVSYYSEDHTKKLDALRDKINARLDQLVAEFNPSLAKY